MTLYMYKSVPKSLFYLYPNYCVTLLKWLNITRANIILYTPRPSTATRNKPRCTSTLYVHADQPVIEVVREPGVPGLLAELCQAPLRHVHSLDVSRSLRLFRSCHLLTQPIQLGRVSLDQRLQQHGGRPRPPVLRPLVLRQGEELAEGVVEAPLQEGRAGRVEDRVTVAVD